MNAYKRVNSLAPVHYTTLILLISLVASRLNYVMKRKVRRRTDMFDKSASEEGRAQLIIFVKRLPEHSINGVFPEKE